MILKRYGAGLLAILITLVTAFVAIPASIYSPEVILGLAIVGLQAVATFGLPLVDGPWRGALKTGVSVILAILAAVIPLVSTGELNPTQIGVVVLAGLNVLASELGVAIRVDPKIAPMNNGAYTVTSLDLTKSEDDPSRHGFQEYEGKHEAIE
jgi:hypothetical protein